MKLPLGKLLDIDDISDKELGYLIPYFRFDYEINFNATSTAMIERDYKPVDQLEFSDILFYDRPPLSLIKRIIVHVLVMEKNPWAESEVVKDMLFYGDYYTKKSYLQELYLQENFSELFSTCEALMKLSLSTLVDIWWNKMGYQGWHAHGLKMKLGVEE